ncbi:MAG: WD40 repeat protein [Myxococcota bacterium]|jgi:WD40 repeat protein
MAKLRGRGGKMILKGHTRQVSTFHRDGNTLASVDWLGALHLWTMWQPKSVQHVAAHTDRAQGVLLGPDWVATCGWDRHVRLWKRSDLSLIAETSVPARGRWFVRLWSLRMSQDGSAMEATLQDGNHNKILRFPLKDGIPNLSKKTVRKQDATTHHAFGTIHATTDPTLVLTASNRNGTPCWSLDLGEQVQRWVACERGEWLLLHRQLPNAESHLEVFEAATGQLKQRIALASTTGVHELLLTADHRMVVAGIGTRVHAWETATGRSLLREDWRHTDVVSSMALTAEGTLITSGWDRTLRLWDLTEVIASLADAPTGTIIDAPEDAEAESNAEAEGPEGITDPDALRAQGYYRAAIAAYKKVPVEGSPNKKTAKAWRLLDVTSCLMKLGEPEEARQLHNKARDIISATNLLNGYAWALFEAGEHERAAFISEASLTIPDNGMREVSAHVLHTWLSILDAQGHTEALIPPLAFRWLTHPEHQDCAPLYARHRQAIDAFLARTPTAEEHQRMVAFEAWLGDDWSSRARAAEVMLVRDPVRWTPIVQGILEEAPTYWIVNPLMSALIAADLEAGRSTLRARLSRWLDDAIANRGKVALRDLVLGVFDDGPAPGVFRKLTKARASYSSFGDAFEHQLLLPPPLHARLQYLIAALDDNCLSSRWGYDITYGVSGATWSTRTATLVDTFDDSFALLLDMFGRVNHRQEYAVAGLAALLQQHRSRTLAAIPLAGPKSQVWLLGELDGKLTPAESRSLMTMLCTSASKPVRAAAVTALKADPLSADGLIPLLTAKRKADRLVGVMVLTHHNRSPDAAALTAALKLEKDAAIRTLLEAWRDG